MEENREYHCVQISCESFRSSWCTVSTGRNFILKMPYLSLDFDLPLNQLHMFFSIISPFGVSQVFLFSSFSHPNVEIDHHWYLARVFCFPLLYCLNFQKPFPYNPLPSLPTALAGSSPPAVFGLRPWSPESTLG